MQPNSFGAGGQTEAVIGFNRGCSVGAYFDDRAQHLAMTTLTDIGSLITSSPGVCGGRPRIAGTGVSVRSVAVCYKSGLSPEEIADQYAHLSLAQIYAALAYYHARRAEVEADLAREEAEYDRLAVLYGRSRDHAP